MKKIISISLAVMLIIACNKDEAVDTNLATAEVTTRSTINPSDFPTLEDDLLKFSSYEHFEQFYKDLDALFDEDQDQADHLLDPIAFESVFDILINDEFEDPSERYQPFVADPIMMYLLNENFEFQIDETLITFMNNEEIVVSSMSNTSTRTALQAMAKGVPVNINALPANAISGPVNTIQAMVFDNCTCDFEIKMISCDEVEVKGRCKNFLWKAGKGHIIIATSPSSQISITPSIFNPNIPVFTPPGTFAVVNTGVTGNFSFIIPVGHFTDKMFVHVNIDPECATGNVQKGSLEINPNLSFCDDENADSGWLWKEQGDEAISYRVDFYNGFFSDYETAEVFSYKKIINIWRDSDTDLIAKITTTRRDQSCKKNGTDAQPKHCSNCNHRRVRVNSGLNNSIYHCDDDVNGQFRKETSSQIIYHKEILEFECCQR